MDTKELGELIKGSEEVFKMRGGSKLELKEEQVTMDFAFATVVSIKDISKGEKLSKDNIWVKRPGTGDIKAEHYKSLLGKVSTKDIKNDEHLTWKDFK
jgi:N-acetylneuraminate synthase